MGDSRLENKEYSQICKSGDALIKNLPLVEISNMTIYLLSNEEIRRTSACLIDSTTPEGKGSLNDARMGTMDVKTVCKTCERPISTCKGHYGVIEFVEPFVNPCMVNALLCVLASVCNCCSKLLISEAVIRANGIHKLKDLDKLRKIKDIATKCWVCPRTRDNSECIPNPIYSINDMKQSSTIIYKRDIVVDDSSETATSSSGKIKKKTVKKEMNSERTIEEVKRILENISELDLRLLGFSNQSHPRDFIMDYLVVIPPTMRPNIIQDGEQKKDFFTTMYDNILSINNKLKNATLSEKQKKDLLKKQYASIYDILIGDPNSSSNQSYGDKSIKGVICSKKGIVRHNIMSKRGDYVERSVIGPGSKLPEGFTGIPRQLASIVTVPEIVTYYNISWVRELYANGKITTISPSDTGIKIDIISSNKIKHLPNVGDIVERHLMTGDQVTLNRQPTLHRQSLAGLKAILHDSLTNRIHSSDTTPTNADFDGDECNIYPHRSVGCRAENMFSHDYAFEMANGQKGGSMIGICYHGLLGAYLLVKDDDIDEEDYEHALGFLYILHKNPIKMRSWKKRLDKYRIKHNSGRALFSATLPPNLFWKKGNFVIKDGILVSGFPDKSTIGIGRSLVHMLYTTYSPNIAQNFISECQWLADWYVDIYGFSLSLSDIPGCHSGRPEEKIMMDDKIDKIVIKVEREIESLGADDPNEPFHVRRMREMKTNNYLNKIEAVGTEITTKHMEPNNSFKIMAECGAKGSVKNIAAMCGLLGQELCDGRRPQLIMSNNTRHLPYFEKGKKYSKPTERGFIRNNYTKGVGLADMFIHFSGSRDGLIDSALKTADTGFMYRKLYKLMDDLCLWYDGSVRRSNGTIVMFQYGNGFSPMEQVKISNNECGTHLNFGDLQLIADII